MFIAYFYIFKKSHLFTFLNLTQLFSRPVEGNVFSSTGTYHLIPSRYLLS